MRELLNAGHDPHLAFGAQLLGITYDEAKARKDEKAVKDARQFGKIFNFGKPGGLGTKTLCEFARTAYGVEMSWEQAEDYTAVWVQTLPEMPEYFDYINRALGAGYGGKGDIDQLFVSRKRGGIYFTEAANTLFQGLGADVAKHALWLVARACYLRSERSALYGSRPCNFVHDSIQLESPEAVAHECAEALVERMVTAGTLLCPDVPLKAEPTVSRYWSKDAKAVYDNVGRLVPWPVAA